MSSHPLTSRFAVLLLAIASSSAAAADVERTGGPYVPTPQVVVDAMLDFAKVGPRDFVVDLGSGDGRIVLTAAERHKARGVGVEIDPELVASSNEEANKRGIAERATFREEDVLKTKIDDATVVTLYLLPGMMQQLQAKFFAELKPGTRIVSHDFAFGEWKPDRETTVDVPEKYGTAGQWKSTLFYWLVPARVGGDWRLSAPGLLAGDQPLYLIQKFQFLEGRLVRKARSVPLASGKLEADRISFRLVLPSGPIDFSGHVEHDRMSGQAMQGERAIAWSATRSTGAAH
jgi:hypothetical protein